MTMTQWFTKARQFLLHDVWDIDLASLSAERSFVVRVVRVAQMIVRGFREDDLFVHASALTFVTLTSLVPILAVAFAVLKGFGFGQDQINNLLDWKDSMPEEFQSFIDTILNIVNTTNFSALGWIGLGFFIFTAAMVLGSVEASFNRIWGVSKPRTYLRQIANYVSVLVLVPVLVGVASTVEASLRGGESFLPESFGWLLRNLLRLTSLFTAWLGFILLFSFVPNTRVRFMPAFISAFFSALLFLGWQKVYMGLQVGVARYNAIYGTFASVPIFLGWLYISWVLILLGAEFAFALQNSATYQMESSADSASSKSRILLSLGILRAAAASLVEDRPRFDISMYAHEKRVPFRLVNSMVRMLVRAGWLAETAGPNGGYVLLKAPDALKVRDVVDCVLQEGAPPEKLGLLHLEPIVGELMGAMDRGLSASLETLTLRDLLKPSS